MTIRSASSIVAVTTLLIALTACTDPVPTPTPTASASSEPTPSPTLAPISAPAPVLDVDCAALVGDATLVGAFAVAVSSIDPAESMMAAYPAISPTYQVRSLGGITCEWSNGEPQSNTTGSNPAYVGARVMVLPNATSQWDRYLAYYGASAAGDYCTDGGGSLYCTTDALVGSTWVEVTSVGASSDAAASALGAEVVAAITAAGPGADPWSPPADTAALPADCTGVIPDAAVQSALGIDVAVQASTGGGGWSLEAGARENWGGPHCYWAFLDADAGVGSLATLPGGAWAWAEAREFLAHPSTPESVTIAGLAAGDEAWIRCAAADTYCLIDLVIAGNWVEAYVWPDDSGFAIDHRAGALAIGEAIVADLG
jgi:hypothetical protein